MSKESWKNVREIATVTAVGAAEGAAIGFATGLGLLSMEGYVAGGIIGGVTALSAELIGRRPKYTIETNDTATVTFNVTTPDIAETVSKKSSETLVNVPLIKVPDMIIYSHLKAFLDTTGDIKKFKMRTSVTK